LKAALTKLPAKNAILDGEFICLDSRGVSQFNALLARKVQPVLYAFDLLWQDGEDLRTPCVKKVRFKASLTMRSRKMHV
jgi:ATP-dependent DNA ligase